MNITDQLNSQYILNYKSNEQYYAILYLYQGAFAIIYEWLCSEDRCSVSEIAELISRLGFEGINSKRK